MLGQQLGDLEVRDGVLRRVRVERAAGRVAPVAADRRLDPARAGARASLDERQVAALELPRPHQLLEAVVRLLRAGGDEQSRGVAVEPVDDPRPLRVAALDLVLEQRLHERAARVPGRRVDDDPGRLVDHEEMGVLVGDPQVELLRIELQLLPAFEAVALRPRAPVEADGARGDEALGLGARADIGQRRDEPVEPLARSRFGDVDPNGQARRAPPSMTVAKRIATPTQMNVSARLNAGQ